MKKIFILPLMLLIVACSPTPDKDVDHSHSMAETTSVKYTCPMHPNVVRDQPGKCPVCGMDLVVASPGNTTPKNNDLMLTDSQIKLGNITTEVVSVDTFGRTLSVNARLTENEESSQVVSSRVRGRIDQLFFRETGRKVQKGEPLYQLYSETLETLQKEYLLAKEQYETLGASEKRYRSFVDAAKRKLLLYGMDQKQIDDLGRTKSIRNVVTFLSPVTGVITEIAINEGQYVEEGSMLMRVGNFHSLWVEAELYANEQSLAREGDRIEIQVTGFENNPVSATVDFLYPEYRQNSQVMILRATIRNDREIFKPGMQARINLTHSERSSLTLPSDAVIRDANGSHVYVQRGRNSFRPKMVTTGTEDGNRIEITDGITEHDTVAVTGAYLLYSELVLKQGSDPMAGHQHSVTKTNNQ